MLVEPSWPGAEKAHFADYFLVLVFFHHSVAHGMRLRANLF
jgi:hypothetical protein